MGVVFARAGGDDRILAIARNGERGLAEESEDADAENDDAQPGVVDTDAASAPEIPGGTDSSPETLEESPDA